MQPDHRIWTEHPPPTFRAPICKALSVDEISEPQWSNDVDQAAWIADRLSAFGSTITSVVPSGFEAYARILHPAEAPHYGHGKLVRWGGVAAWSGLPLRPDSQFHSIALPKSAPESPAPWDGQGPQPGGLYSPDAQSLAAILRQWTSRPDECWFGLWDGYGWEGRIPLAAPGERVTALPDPVPESVRNGPRVHLPHRDYLLYSGPVEAVLASVSLADSGQTPNLWWPDDRTWFVASEIDLAWTYVGGSAGMVKSLIKDDRIEALPAEPSDALWRVEPWLEEMVDAAVSELLGTGMATISTVRGTVNASYQAPRRLRAGELRIRTATAGGSGTGRTPFRSDDSEFIRANLISHLTHSVIQLVGG